MRFIASASKERFDELQKNPLVFCKYGSTIVQDEQGTFHTSNGWISCDSTINVRAYDRNVPSIDRMRRLFVVGNQILTNGKVDDNKKGKDVVDFVINEFNFNSSQDWVNVFNDCLYNKKSGNDRHCHMALFWALYKTTWNKTVMQEAISKTSKEAIQVVSSYIAQNIFSLSIAKQELLVELFSEINPNIQVAFVQDVEEALNDIAPQKDFRFSGFYEKVDFLLKYGSQTSERDYLEKLYKNSNKPFILFKFWMNNVGSRLYNYKYLENIYSYVDDFRKLLILKRYLHDVRLKLTEINYSLIENLRDIRYKPCVDIRYFITTPGDNIELAAQLFCDVLLTLKNSEGHKLQDFNGIMDFAVRHSNKSCPKINFGVERFLPICDGGLKPNSSFIGFIRYAIHYTFDQTKLTEENLKKTIDYLLQNFADKVYQNICSVNNTVLSEDEYIKCSSVFKILKFVDKESKRKCFERVSCLKVSKEPVVPHVWKKKSEEFNKILDLFVENIESKEFIKEEDLNIERFKQFLIEWGNKIPTFIFMNNVPPNSLAKNNVRYHVVRMYYSPTTMDVFPNKGVFFSGRKDLLGIWNDKFFNDVNEQERFAQKVESPIVYGKTFDSLKSMYPRAIVGKDHISLPYNKTVLDEIKASFHFRGYSFDFEDEFANFDLYKLRFLNPGNIPNKYFCTPKIANLKEAVSGLRYFLCRSNECFCNVLDEQTLEKQKNWRKYTLYHAAEILGFKLIVETDGWNVPVESVSNFAAEVVQAEKKYARLICKSCGHMIFSTSGTLLNGSRHFECKNPFCSQLGKDIYLSQCNNCKTGLIDSRESKKCENGWVICPSCLACCNDNVYERLIENHRRNGYIPHTLSEMVGKGHNNKGVFFCPNCGSRLEEINDEETIRHEDGTVDIIPHHFIGCPQCGRTYEKEMESYRKCQERNKS